MTNLDLAKQWAQLDKDLSTSAEKRDLLMRDCEDLRTSRETVGKTLRATLGAQIPQRLFDLGDGRVVMVSVTGGVELVQMERAGKEPADG